MAKQDFMARLGEGKLLKENKHDQPRFSLKTGKIYIIKLKILLKRRFSLEFQFLHDLN